MTMFRKLGFFVALVLLVCSGRPAHAQRVQAYAVQCVGFSSGQTHARVSGYISMASTGLNYGFAASCDSTINGGEAVITGPTIPASAGPVTSMTFLIDTWRTGTFYREKLHSAQTSTGFLSATFMADPVTATGEVHLLISVP
jgi:hypothetical protein